MKAVIDRFEGDQAVLLINDGKDQLIIARQILPGDAKQGDWLQIEIKDGKVVRAVIDKDETARVKQKIANKFARLL
jgi:hypothetical protein